MASFTDKETSFKRHHAEHPEVFETFCEAALFMAQQGSTNISGNTIANELKNPRSEFNQSLARKPVKFTNNDRPFYARMCLERYPELKGALSVKDVPQAQEDLNKAAWAEFKAKGGWQTAHEKTMRRLDAILLSVIPDSEPRKAEVVHERKELTARYLRKVSNLYHRSRVRLKAASTLPSWGAIASACNMLGIEPPITETQVDIKRASKARNALVRGFHPDTNGGDHSHLEDYQAVLQAHDTIRDWNDALRQKPIAPNPVAVVQCTCPLPVAHQP